MTGLGTADGFTTFAATVAFWVAAIAAIVTAYLMVFRIRNLVRSALALTTVLGSVAMMYALLGADFLAISQLVVYVGAIMVLIIFAIFMTPGQIDVPGLVGQGHRVGALLVSIGFGVISVVVVITTPWKVRDAVLDVPTAEAIGGLMLTRYVLPFEIASLLLTVALIGAIVIARED
ncbi:MAG TPA: NADH-quinone oxidoreductase subunit J [Chloroflexota bacterium]|nr:NADH-quinone oxidoreductase subunit J [Chloroflexota bacterium]